MAKRATAHYWDASDRDETGAFVDLKYTCPYCDFENDEQIFIGPSNVDKLDSPWETDQTCDWCGKDVIVGCR